MSAIFLKLPSTSILFGGWFKLYGQFLCVRAGVCVWERELEFEGKTATCHFSAASGNISDSDGKWSVVGCRPNGMKAGQRYGVWSLSSSVCLCFHLYMCIKIHTSYICFSRYMGVYVCVCVCVSGLNCIHACEECVYVRITHCMCLYCNICTPGSLQLTESNTTACFNTSSLAKGEQTSLQKTTVPLYFEWQNTVFLFTQMFIFTASIHPWIYPGLTLRYYRLGHSTDPITREILHNPRWCYLHTAH